MDVSLVEARERLDDLAARASAGETVWLVRDGEPVAELTPIPPELPLAELQALKASMPMQKQSAGDFIREMRDEDRY